MAVTLFPTPTAMTGHNRGSLNKWGGSGARKKMKQMTTPEEFNGRLNPQFVEWLMGYPTNWTALEDLATPSSLKSSRRSAKQSSRQKG